MLHSHIPSCLLITELLKQNPNHTQKLNTKFQNALPFILQKDESNENCINENQTKS